ncbi:MAG: hypothetical protein MZU91_13680 [Desulfosudis oleivorans]|nr:hypothetical protein [Desulfosudis oleivorans]
MNWPMLAYSQTISSVILAVDAAHSLRALILKHPRKIDSAVRNRIASGFFISATNYLQAQKGRAKLKDQSYDLLKEVDLLAGPNSWRACTQNWRIGNCRGRIENERFQSAVFICQAF